MSTPFAAITFILFRLFSCFHFWYCLLQQLICSISLMPMQDPVILCTGQTYEPSNIRKVVLSWLTWMQALWDDSITPKNTLHQLLAISHTIGFDAIGFLVNLDLDVQSRRNLVQPTRISCKLVIPLSLQDDLHRASLKLKKKSLVPIALVPFTYSLFFSPLLQSSKIELLTT